MAVIPASHPAPLPLLIRDLLGTVLRHCFFLFSLCTLLFPFASQVLEKSVGGKKSQQTKTLFMT